MALETAIQSFSYNAAIMNEYQNLLNLTMNENIKEWNSQITKFLNATTNEKKEYKSKKNNYYDYRHYGHVDYEKEEGTNIEMSVVSGLKLYYRDYINYDDDIIKKHFKKYCDIVNEYYDDISGDRSLKISAEHNDWQEENIIYLMFSFPNS